MKRNLAAFGLVVFVAAALVWNFMPHSNGEAATDAQKRFQF